jgi:DNA-binding response OmpR family regulator
MVKKILIIEDEAILQKAVIEYLTADGFGTIGAFDGEQGLKLAKSELPDLIILDIILPKVDGYKVLEELKKDESTKKIPIIALTNLESMENIQKAFEQGVNSYLIKADYKLEDVAAKIRETLKMNPLKKRNENRQ